VYNSGRIITYALLGATSSMAGLILSISNYANGLSIAFGMALLIIAFFRVDIFRTPMPAKITGRLTGLLKNTFAVFLSKKSKIAMFSLGMLNGLLPCGMTFIALSYCLLLPDARQGFIYMVFFGLGTLPVMLGLATLAFAAVRHYNLSLQKITTGMLFISGLLLIGRVFIHAGAEADHEKSEVIDIVICR